MFNPKQDHGVVYGHRLGVLYEQNGKTYNAMGDEINADTGEVIQDARSAKTGDIPEFGRKVNK